MNLFPAEAGVRPCFVVRNWSVLGLPGVASTEVIKTFPTITALEGEFPVPFSSRRSNNPSTCPSFCGVGPRTVLFKGVNRFRTIEGEAYGSTSHGCIELFEGVFIICCLLETPCFSFSSRFRLWGVLSLVTGAAGGTFPESKSRVLLYSLYLLATRIVNTCYRRGRRKIYQFQGSF
jgi:hypothetical protein